ncbi:MAG: orotidine-5'-phosphate decarboxylase [Deltaproteobacteria bacterium]
MSTLLPHERIIAALDVPTALEAEGLARELRGSVGMLKVGLELFCGEGPALLAPLTRQAKLFLDLKLHDIPQTVEAAARQVGRLGATFLTVHAAGGAAMVAAAVRGGEDGAARAGQPPPAILAVTVLTSLNAEALRAIGLSGEPEAAVARLGALALGAGAAGLVCSPLEVAPLRRELGQTPLLVVPGIRPAGAALGDQARVATPGEAILAGADYLVIGRPLREGGAPREAARRIADEIRVAQDRL